MITRRSAARRSLAPAPVVALSCGLLLLAGCSPDTSTAGAVGQGAGAQSGNGRSTDPGRVSGEIAAVDGKTLQIQDGQSQTAVTYTAKTTFSAQVKGTLADISKGECVVVLTSSTDPDATKVTATSLTATAATDGQCGFGFGGGGGQPSGTPSGQPAPNGSPSGAVPSGAPSGMPNGGVRPRSGKVTAIDGATLTVAVSQPGSEDTTELTVRTTDDTTVALTEKSKASAAKVGVCATVNGKADDTGAVTANSITLREAGKDGCTLRRGNR